MTILYCFSEDLIYFNMLNIWRSLMDYRAVLVNTYGITETTVHVTI